MRGIGWSFADRVPEEAFEAICDSTEEARALHQRSVSFEKA